VYAVEYGGADRTVLLVWARASRPAEVVITPRTLDPGRRYRLRESAAPDVRAGEAVTVPFALAADADVLVLEAAS
jgi:hypothetical protein